MKPVIIVGGGHSIREGLDKGLWDKIQKHEKWSLNGVFKTMPYLPNRQVWVDIDFLDNMLSELQKLHQQNVPLVSKEFGNHRKFAFLQYANLVKEYPTTRVPQEYYGKKALDKNSIYFGSGGFCGTFALSLAIAEGYTDIYLLGYDLGTPNVNLHSTHYYQEDTAKYGIYSTGVGRPKVYRLEDNTIRKELLEDYDVYKNETDINIWNVSLQSNLTQFPKVSYDEFFEKINLSGTL